jgi:sulfoquinovosyltransferase
VPSELSEQEEYAKEWAHKPRRIALFVEPSPFAYVSQQLLLPATP